MQAKNRPATKNEAELINRVQAAATPLLFPGRVLCCTNPNTSEFSYMQRYRIERTFSPAGAGVALAAVRNNNGELRVIPSTAWAFNHWEFAR